MLRTETTVTEVESPVLLMQEGRTKAMGHKKGMTTNTMWSTEKIISLTSSGGIELYNHGKQGHHDQGCSHEQQDGITGQQPDSFSKFLPIDL